MGTFTTLTASEVEEILAGFGLSGYRRHQPIAAGTINTNVRVELDGGVFFLRINEGKPQDEVAREAAIVTHVAARGVPTPVPLPGRHGSLWLAHRGMLISLFPWVPGLTLDRAQIGVGHARGVGRALAALHLAGADFPDHRPGRYEPGEIMRRLQDLENLDRSDVAAALCTLRSSLEPLRTARATDLPMGVIHGDLFIDNVLFAPDATLTALLDFEQASWGRLAYDVAVTVLAFGFGHDDFRVAETRALLDAYAAVRQPDPSERRAFAAELRFAACRFAITRITDVHLRREAGAPRGKDFRRYLLRLERIDAHLQADDGLLALG